MQQLIVVGCDFGLRKSGVVVLNERSEILEQALIRVKSTGAKRLYEIEQSFDSLVRRLPDQEIHFFIEGYAYGAKYQRESLAELGGVMRRYFYTQMYDFWVVPPTSVKSFVTGSGKASKNYMKKRTREKWGLTFRSDDICDAHGLAKLGVEVMNSLGANQIQTNVAEEREILEDILAHKEHYQNGNTAKRSRKRTTRNTSK